MDVSEVSRGCAYIGELRGVRGVSIPAGALHRVSIRRRVSRGVDVLAPR